MGGSRTLFSIRRSACFAAAAAAALALAWRSEAAAQTACAEDSLLQAGASKVYLDLPEKYHDYIKAEIPWVNYVRDRHLADVQILLTKETTGSGGDEFTLTLFGRGEFDGVNDTLVFSLEPSYTEDAARSAIVTHLERGLVRYVEKTPVADYLDISYTRRSAPEAMRDRWDYWVFAVSAQGWAQGEKSYDNAYLWSTVSADRVTSSLKIGLDLGSSYNESAFDVGGATITSISRSHYLSGTAVKSAGEHWSYGIFTGLSSSSYGNTDLELYAGPAVEYNVFPYSEYTRRELRVLYRILYYHDRYLEETIYGFTEEDRLKERLSIEYVAKEPWGSISASVLGSHYLHDFDKNRLTFTCDLSLLIVRGLSLTLAGSASLIHDLLSPAKGEASTEELLLRQQLLDTQYTYYVSFGFQYSFGSIYTNVVNPRFGG